MTLGVLQVLAVMAVSVAMALSLADALEFPGKKRLTKDAYCGMQAIYCPGFTFGGFGEPGATILIVILLCLMPAGTMAFWLTLVSLVGLILMQTVYWLVTHPVNGFWLRDQNLGRFGSGFFSFGSARRRAANPVKWTELRDRWEYSHVVRAGLAVASLAILVTSVVVS